MVTRSLVCVTPYLPHEGIDHAGGNYLLRYLNCALDFGWQVSAIAPASWANRSAKPPDGIGVELHMDTPTWIRPWHLLRTGVPLQSGSRWWNSLSPRARTLLARADVIDLQWADCLWNAPVLRRHLPRTPLTGLSHDLRSVGIKHALRTPPGRPLVEAVLAFPGVVRAERRALDCLDELLVFKEEDRALLRARGVTVPIALAPLPLPPVHRLPKPSPQSRRVLLAGAMFRPENAEAATWFARNVWPEVRAQVPGATWRIAGARPKREVAALAGADVEVTGFLDDLLNAYRDVACVVVPLRRGAGVKFKTIEAIAGGFPLVTTTVGAEGVADAVGAELPLVTDDAEAFAKAVVNCLTAPAGAILRAGELRRELLARPAFESAVAALLERWGG